MQTYSLGFFEINILRILVLKNRFSQMLNRYNTDSSIYITWTIFTGYEMLILVAIIIIAPIFSKPIIINLINVSYSN